MASKFHIPNLIEKKAAKERLTKEEIEYFIEAVGTGQVQSCQLGAWLMSVFLNGMGLEETTHLTAAMVRSGEVLSWPESWKGLVADKHSTGGVGDKVSLPLAPTLAACGLKIPMISGRGLGHTGGTLDKLESIPGFGVSQSSSRMVEILEEVGCCIVGQTETLVPADRIMYATRDITGTVCSLPLIASSIVSKKAAETLSALVLDVKTGKGAMLNDYNEAKELATRMVGISKGVGIQTAAVLTDMTNPIGFTIGNALEVQEALDCLHGNGPEDLKELVITLGGQLLNLSGKASSPEEGSKCISTKLADGSSLAKFKAMIIAQGVSPETASALCDDKTNDVLPKAKFTTKLLAKKSGFVSEIDAMACAKTSVVLGAGRAKAGDSIQYDVGLQLLVAKGDAVKEGDAWMVVHHNCDLKPDHENQLQRALTISTDCCPNTSRILEIIR